MKQRKTALSLLVAFAVGCGASQLGSQLVVKPARAGTSPTRWEYDCRRIDDGVTDLANKMGAQGWEMTAAAGAGWGNGLLADHTMVWCFKRALP
jgi:hypothetical protein